ncbi:hypothetical protein F4814DRAFT_435104 [Daldinia grandis]|nr:hypothetical protein F4814DRAFT_435104 [Daldinia grandis]
MAVSYTLNLLSALLRTRLVATVSLIDYYCALCTQACTFCDELKTSPSSRSLASVKCQ